MKSILSDKVYRGLLEMDIRDNDVLRKCMSLGTKKYVHYHVFRFDKESVIFFDA